MNLEHRIFNQIIRRQLLKEILIEEIPKKASALKAPESRHIRLKLKREKLRWAQAP